MEKQEFKGTVREVIKAVLDDKDMTQIGLVEKLNERFVNVNMTKTNLNNKMQRDNFSAKELVELADALELELIFRDKADTDKVYHIDYPEEEKGQPKRVNKSN